MELFLTCKLSREEKSRSIAPKPRLRWSANLGFQNKSSNSEPFHIKVCSEYRACHIYVTPAYAETFAHPLVEAMACGLPVVASNCVHREICGDAAPYFPRFSLSMLADSHAARTICSTAKKARRVRIETVARLFLA